MRTCLLIVPATLLLLGAAACGSPAYPSSASPTGVASASGSAASAWVTATPTPSPSPPTPATSSPGTATAAAPPTPARAPAPPKGRPLAGIVVVVDPGHDGGNAAHPQISQRLVNAVTMMKPCDSTGTQDGTGYPEHLFTWQLGQILAADLKALGATVVLTRHSDTGVGPCMTVRSAIANAAHADAVLTLHADGAAASGHGFHVIRPVPVGPNDGMVKASFALAAAVHDALISAGVPPSNYTGSAGYTTRSDLGGLNLSTVPKIFIEFGNMRNPTEAAKLRSTGYKRALATALADGVVTYLGSRK